MSGFNDDDLIEVPDEEVVTLLDEDGQLPATEGEDDNQAMEEELPEDDEGDNIGGEDNPSSGDPSGSDSQEDETGKDPQVDQAADQQQDGNHRKGKGKDFQGRINELTRARKSAEERAAAAEARLKVVEQEREQEAKELQRKQRESELVAERKAAEDEGDLEAYSKANDEIVDIRLERKQPVQHSESTEKPETQPDEVKIHDAAQAWIERNAWYQDSNNEDLAQEVEHIEQGFRDRGEPIGEALYAKIDQVIAVDPRFADVRPDTGGQETEKAEQETESQRPQPEGKPNLPAAPTNPGETANPGQQKGRLTQHDIRTMRTFKLDPNNPTHRKTYLEYKR